MLWMVIKKTCKLLEVPSPSYKQLFSYWLNKYATKLKTTDVVDDKMIKFEDRP